MFSRTDWHGIAQDDPRLPERWSKTENVRWVTEVPGWGWSCPIVVDGKMFLTAVVNEKEYEKPQKGLHNGTGRPEPPEGMHRWMVYCLDLDSGKVLWKHEAHQGRQEASTTTRSFWTWPGPWKVCRLCHCLANQDGNGSPRRGQTPLMVRPLSGVARLHRCLHQLLTKPATPSSIPVKMACFDAAAKKRENPRFPKEKQGFSAVSTSRGGEIRTLDLLHPKQAR